MGLDYSYTQPSESEDLFDHSVDSETSDLIRRDQAELSLNAPERVQYPPQPEVEFGFPQICYCGAQPVLATSTTDPGRRYYTCKNVDDGECHVWKLWDVAVMEEMRARDRHVLLLAEKVENLSLPSDYDTEQKLFRLEKIVSDMAKERTQCSHGFEVFVAVMVLVMVLVGVLLVMVM